MPDLVALSEAHCRHEFETRDVDATMATMVAGPDVTHGPTMTRRRRVAVRLVASVRFEGDKVAHEHIYWDQASVLGQVGLLDSKSLPVAGIETARKVADNALPSNRLMTRWATSAGKPI